MTPPRRKSRLLPSGGPAPAWPPLRCRRAPLFFAGAALLAFLLAGPAAAVEVSDPVNLGAPGLTLELRLYHFGGAAWTSADASAVVAEDLGDGDYLFDQLPTAAGLERYRLVVATAAAPEVALAEYSWGARPGTRIVTRLVDTVPARPRTFRQFDDAGSIGYDVLSGLPAAIADPGTAATFTLYHPATAASVVAAAPAVIANAAEDLTTGTWGATFTYDLEPGDLDLTGQHLGEFKICYAGGECHRLPQQNTLTVGVTEAFP